MSHDHSPTYTIPTHLHPFRGASSSQYTRNYVRTVPEYVQVSPPRAYKRGSQGSVALLDPLTGGFCGTWVLVYLSKRICIFLPNDIPQGFHRFLDAPHMHHVIPHQLRVDLTNLGRINRVVDAGRLRLLGRIPAIPEYSTAAHMEFIGYKMQPCCDKTHSPLCPTLLACRASSSDQQAKPQAGHR